jgi:hypothetical protein
LLLFPTPAFDFSSRAMASLALENASTYTKMSNLLPPYK